MKNDRLQKLAGIITEARYVGRRSVKVDLTPQLAEEIRETCDLDLDDNEILMEVNKFLDEIETQLPTILENLDYFNY